MSWWEWILVALAGAVGAPARYVVDIAVSEWRGGEFPFGTFAVNVSGSFLLGVLTGLALYHGMGDVPKAVLGTGLLGAYTTFSTFSYETIQLLEERRSGAALTNLTLSLLAGALAAGAGLALAAIQG